MFLALVSSVTFFWSWCSVLLASGSRPRPPLSARLITDLWLRTKTFLCFSTLSFRGVEKCFLQNDCFPLR